MTGSPTRANTATGPPRPPSDAGTSAFVLLRDDEVAFALDAKTTDFRARAMLGKAHLLEGPRPDSATRRHSGCGPWTKEAPSLLFPPRSSRQRRSHNLLQYAMALRRHLQGAQQAIGRNSEESDAAIHKMALGRSLRSLVERLRIHQGWAGWRHRRS
jgi:hypothetical protein